VHTVCSALGKPFNFMVGIPGKSWSLAELESAGVRRVSLATSLYKAAITGLVSAAREIREKGTFGYVDSAIASKELSGYMRH
jgi:2-methylisocitrate lyase-like PEP mutase family enzyme